MTFTANTLNPGAPPSAQDPRLEAPIARDPVAHMELVLKPSSLGLILVARSAGNGRGLRAVFIDDKADSLLAQLRDSFPGVSLIAGDTELEAIATRVVEFVEVPTRGLDVPLDLRGTEFQQRVWQALREIPAGSTASYTDIARRIGRPTAVRAVGHACAVNNLALAIPCHRAVRSDGSLAGYRWGLERKRILLEREAAS